ncbi:MAG: histidinol phosphate phosphatase domain-containing protein [Nitrospiraceae bacterium]|nr:histidinol phosphate phosphatase domain-containing protein [Nitrospiraceae bacterium]
MIDLHTHTLFSDGELLPAELIQRASVIGYKAIAITDHVDQSNIDIVIPRIIKVLDALKDSISITAIPGVEITHVPPSLISSLVKEARQLGAKIVVVHGETTSEPVKEGTNRAAIEAGVDILAHPGLISTDDIKLAKEKGVALEITSRKGHSFTNGHVGREAIKHGATLVINTDTHSPYDLISLEKAKKILAGAGIDEDKIKAVFNNSKTIVEKILRRN